MQITWEILKNLAQAKQLNIQFTEEDERYTVYFIENGITRFCYIFKTTPRNSDQEDFEDNFKADSNKKVEDKVFDILDGEGTQASLSVGTSPIEVKAGSVRLNGRKSVVVYNNSNRTIWYGFNNSLTVSNGIPIPRGGERRFNIGSNFTLYLISEVANTNVRINEAF